MRLAATKNILFIKDTRLSYDSAHSVHPLSADVYPIVINHTGSSMKIRDEKAVLKAAACLMGLVRHLICRELYILGRICTAAGIVLLSTSLAFAIAIPDIPIAPVIPPLIPARDATPRPLLFAYVANQAGYDTAIIIENTSKDALGTHAQSGTCMIRFIGSPANSSQISTTVAAGDAIVFSLASGGSHGISPVAGFAGYVIADCTFPLARGFSVLRDLVGNSIASEQAEILEVPRDNTLHPLLFQFATNQVGFDTGLVIANTGLDYLGSASSSGTCTLRYNGAMSNGSALPPPQTTPVIQPGQTFAFALSSGMPGGTASTAGFQGYVVVQCSFPHARGYSFVAGSGMLKIGTAEKAEILNTPRGIQAKPLLFRFAVNQAGYDTGIYIANTSWDGLVGTKPQSGTCTLRFYGSMNSGLLPPPQTTPVIQPGSYYTFTLSQGVAGSAGSTAGFQGYIIAQCTFPHARGYSLLSNLGSTKLAASETAEVLELPRSTTARPLLFSFVTNSGGYDTGIAIANTSLDGLGTEPQSGSCTVRYYGQMSYGSLPAAQTTSVLAAGQVSTFSLSAGGVPGSISSAAGFQGYIIAQCSFPHARGYALISDIAEQDAATAAPAEIVLPLDSDHDGTPNAIDLCDNDPAKTSPGQCGCGVPDTDSDGDGTANCIDLCPQDAGKTTPGVCGCAISDADSDSDGTADCQDLCPNDAAKTMPGICGCAAADNDSDADGTADCIDSCPQDSAKVVPGQCGCGYEDSDKDGDGTADCGTNSSGLCISGPAGSLDCAQEVLSAAACAGVNGFLGQINIATVLNLQAVPLNVTVKYLNAAGTVANQVSTTIAGNLKSDFIINDLGLAPDTYGTVCVETDAAVGGAWTGGVTLYKPDLRQGSQPFGSNFDFALYHPFTNPRSGAITVGLNTFHLGTAAQDPVANWISITDADRGDGQGLSGTLRFYDSSGQFLGQEAVSIPDGGRVDYSGHAGLTSGQNVDAVGMATFAPDAKAGGGAAVYYLEVSRYFYDCAGAACTNFLAAFTLPYRPGTQALISGRVSTLDNELSVVELSNTWNAEAVVDFRIFDAPGNVLTQQTINIAPLATKHVLVNQVAGSGYLPAQALGSVQVQAISGYISAAVFQYKLDQADTLLYGYAVPLTGPGAALQVSQFNSFISHANTVELSNTTGAPITVSLDFVAYNSAHLYGTSATVPAHGALRFEPALPADTYGTINIQAAANGLTARAFDERRDQYLLLFAGQ